MKNFFSIILILLFVISFVSCKKEKTQEELLKGDYSLKYASIDGLDVTDYLLNDSINLTYLRVGNLDGGFPFYFYFRPVHNYSGSYTSQYTILDENKLSIYNTTSEGVINFTIDNNLGFLPFSKQKRFVLNIEMLTEDQFVFNTIYSDKIYRYEFTE